MVNDSEEGGGGRNSGHGFLNFLFPSKDNRRASSPNSRHSSPNLPSARTGQRLAGKASSAEGTKAEASRVTEAVKAARTVGDVSSPALSKPLRELQALLSVPDQVPFSTSQLPTEQCPFAE